MEDFPDPDEWLKGEERYVASLERVLNLSKDFQRSLKPVQQKPWLELEEALLDHSRLLQEACYVAGKQRGATEGAAHWSQELVKTVAAALRRRSGEAELVELLIKAIELHTAEQLTTEQRTTEQRGVDQRRVDQHTAEQLTTERRATERRTRRDP